MRRALLALLIACALGSSAARAAPHEMAFQFVQERQILFPITVNGRPAEAWLDSGAGAIVLDAAFARKLGVELGPEIRAHGVTGQIDGVRRAKVDLAAGDLAMPGRRVVVMDLSAVARLVARPVEVLLGRDVFEEAVVDLDFAGRRISLLPRAGFVAPKREALPLTPSADLRSFPIVVAGTPTPAILDLGNAGGLLLDKAFADAHAMLAGRTLSTELGVGADGPREQIQTTLDRVQVGGVSLAATPTVVAEGLSSRAPANVGLQILSRFHLTIDFAGDRLWMAPYADAATRPFRKNRTGLMLVPENRDGGGGKLVVDYVAKGSPAERGGWKKGETVAALDGRPIGSDYIASDASLWVYGPPGRTVTLTLGDGSQRKLTLADYF